MTQIVGNLLANACRYTPRLGDVYVTATHEAGDAIAVRVRDTGIGIAPEKLESIFEMFGQIQSPLERTHSGLGIGLNLARKLAQMHGGTVAATSEGVGKGSEFVLRLPASSAWAAGAATPQAIPLEAVAASEGLAPKRILIADDNVDAAESLALLLRLGGHETRTAHDGLAAIEMAKQFQPDLVLMDIGMPTVNGYEACREIVAGLRDRAPLMIAVSGWGQHEDRRASADAGFDYHFIKPLILGDLNALLDSQAARGPGAQPKVRDLPPSTESRTISRAVLPQPE